LKMSRAEVKQQKKEYQMIEIKQLNDSHIYIKIYIYAFATRSTHTQAKINLLPCFTFYIQHKPLLGSKSNLSSSKRTSINQSIG
jgi:hypothetical protein